jgi:NADH dehydrogenase FAD-containing subunit
MVEVVDLERGRPARLRARGPRSDEQHRIAVVGGGAAGLELVTRLGDRLGRRGRAQPANGIAVA